MTTVLVGDTVSITAANLNINAISDATLTTTSKSTVGGATDNDQSTKDDLNASGATTAEGGLGLAAAFARSKSNQTTSVTIQGDVSLTATGAINLKSDESTTKTTSADGSATNNAGTTGNGVGVSIAVDRSEAINRVVVAGKPTLATPQFNISAASASGENHTTTATSGAGASNVGFAGGFASTNILTSTESIIADNANLSAGGAAISLTANSNPTLSTEAKPVGATNIAAKKGVGASIARTKMVNTTRANVGTAATIANAKSIAATANTIDNINTNAVTGGTGGTAATAGVATAVIDSTITAMLGQGPSTTFAGPVSLNANHGGNISTTVAGDVLAEKAAIGGSFALNDVDVNATSSIERSLIATGDVSAKSQANGSVSTESKASTKGTGETTKTSDQQTAEQQAAIGSDKEAPSADAKGKVSASAAAAINLVDVHARAFVAATKSVTTSGKVAFVASNSVDVTAKSNAIAVGSGTTTGGTTTGGTEFGVGVAVAINRANVSAETTIGTGTNVNASGGLLLDANSTVGEDTARLFSAESISGAGARKTGFAGSFSINKVLNTSSSTISNGSTINVGANDLSVIATNTATNSVNSTPSPENPATGGKRGIGTSFALNIAENSTISDVSANTILNSTPVAGSTQRSNVTAISVQTASTVAKAAAGSEETPGAKSLTPVFAIQAITNTTNAKLDSDAASIRGNLQVLANLAATNTITAEGSSIATDTARGLTLALDLGDNQTNATVDGTVVAGNAMLVNAKADVAQTILAKASSKGGDTTPTEGGADKETADAKNAALAAGAKDNGEETPELKTPTGPVSFAAAIAIGLSRTNTKATLADGSNIDAGGKLTVSSSADVDSSVISNASALTVSAAQEETDGIPPHDPPANDASGRGVGVAIAVNVNRVNTLSSIGIGNQVQSEGLTVSAGNSLRDRHTFHTEAASGAGGGEVGTAGSFAINVIRNTTDARVHASNIDAGQGQVEVLATNKANSTNVSKPSSNATGSKRGRGASFAVNVTRNTTTAEIEDNVLLRKNGTVSDSGATSVLVKATSNHNTTTESLGGAGSEDELGESAVTGVFALNLAVNTTTARASGSDTGNSHASGNVTVEATHSGTTATKAEGASRAEDTNVGIVLGLGFSRDLVAAELDGGWIVDGSVSTKSSNDAISSSDSKASARGGEADKESEKDGKLGDVEVKTSESKNLLEETDGQAIEEETPKPKTPDASLGFAGALAVNVATAKSTARIKSKARLVAAGSVQLVSVGQASVNSSADASAVVIPVNEVNDAQNAPPNTGNAPPLRPNPSQTGVGVAIDVNVANVRTEATVSGNAKITAASLSLDAGTASNGTEDHAFSSKAISGTGVDKVGFAGSLAINVITNDSTANIGSNAEINLLGSTDPDLAGTSKDLTLKSRNETSSTVDSVASVAGSPKTGIGPSIATNVSRNSSNASVADSVVFLTSVDDYTVDAVGNYTMNTNASSGSTAKATLSGEGGLAISPALSVASHKNSTTAVGSEGTVFQSLNVLGNLNVQATHVSITDGQAEAKVNASGKAAIGIPIVVNVLRDNVSASSKGDFTVAGSADVRATSDIQVDGDATASVAGARAGTGGAAGLKQRAQEYVDGFRRDEGEKVVKIADRLEARLTEAGDMIDQLTTAKVQTTGVAASGVANVVLSDSTAEVNGTILATGAVNVIAEGDRDITADVSGLAVSPTFAEAYGGALAINIAEQTFTARAFTDNGLAGDSITVRAGNLTGNTHLVKSRALAGGGAKDDSVAGSIGFNIVDDKIAASIGQSPIENGVLTMNVQAAKGITIRSQSDLEIQNIAGAAAIGIQGDGVGGALAVNSIRNATQSVTGPTTTLATGGKLSVTASSNIEPTKGDVTGDPIALAAGGSGGGDQARAGSLAANVFHEQTLAEIGADNVISTTQIVGPRGIVVPGDVVVDSLSSTELRTGAGAIAIGLKLGQSVGVAANIINKDIDSHIGTGTTMNAQGKVDVVSISSEDTFSIAAAPGLGGSVNKPTFGGAIQLTSQVVNVRAIVDEDANLTVRDDVRVESQHQVDADVITGSISGGQNNSVAGSLTIVSLLDRTEAMIAANATVTVAGATGLTVKATSNENILPVAIAGSGAGDNANAGSITLTRIHETTLAHIDEGATINAHNSTSAGTIKPSILVLAEDNTVLNNAAGVAAVGGKKGLGGSLDATKIDKNTTAFVAGGAHLDADRNITVSAKSSEDVLSVSASIGVSGQTSVLGSLSGYGVDVTTRAILGDNPLDLLEPIAPVVAHAAGSVVVTAEEKNEMDFIGGGVGVSGGTAVGGAASVAVVRKTTEAMIAPTAQVSADALATVEAVNVNNGRFNIAFPDVAFDSGRVQPPTFPSRDSDGDGQTDLDDSSILRPRVVTNATETRRGVVVAATNRDDIAAIVAGGGVGSGFTIGVSTPAAILRVDTTARIADNAQINTGNQNTAGNNQSVLVAAASDYSHLSLSGALAVSGGGAIAPAGNIESTRINTIAAIGANADVAAKRDVEVQANATEDSLLITASGSATGSGGGNGSIAVFALNNQTHASIGAGADVDAGGNVVVSASDVSDLDSIAGAAAISGAAGVSVSLGVNVIHKDTQAFIANDASVDAKANSSDVTVFSDVGSTTLTTQTTRGVVVQAYSKESLLDIAASGSVSGAVGGAGGINVNVIDSDTSAFIGDRANINTNTTGENALQSVHVIAGNELDARSIAGGLAIGSIALAGSVDIGVVRSDTTSFVGQGATVNAVNDIVVESLANEKIDSLGVSGGFAAGTSFAGAVAVWALGTQFDATYSDDSTTTNSLSQNGSTVDQQAANSAARVASILSSGLSNFSGVNGGAPADATPKSQIADILRQGKTSVDQGLTRSQITTELFDSSDATGTVAEVREGAILAAGDDIEIEAKTKVDLNAIAGSGSGSAIAAVGASVTVERVHLKTDAFFAGTIQDADQVSIQSIFNNNVDGSSLAGQGALFGALGAAVTSIRDESSTTARVDGSPTTTASIQQAGVMTINATSSTNLEGSTGQGALAIGGAAGVTVTKVIADGKTSALVGDNVNVGGQPGKAVSSLTVDANATTTATSRAFALAAGVGGAATLNFATAEVTPAIEASLGSRTVASNSNIDVNGNVGVNAISNSDANADLFGLQLAAGAALGFSRAKTILASDVDAAIGRNTTVDAGGSVAILAQHNKPTILTLPNGTTRTITRGADAQAEAGAAAAIAGNTARAFSVSSPSVNAVLFDGASIASDAAVTVKSDSTNNANSTGGSLTIGLAGAGGVETTADIDGIASAALRNNAIINAASLDVRSLTNDRAISEGRAATGGILSGNATTASASIKNARTKPNSSVSVLGSTINVTDSVRIISEQEADADAFAKGISIGGILAAGKSEASIDVTPSVKADVSSSTIVAGGIVDIGANFGDGSAPSVTARNIEEAEALAADEISTAFAKGSGGALIGLVGSSATSIYKPKANTEVGPAVSIAGLNVTVSSEADSGTAAIARNVAVGFVARGKADTRVDMKNTVAAEVVGGPELSETHIDAANNFTLRVDSSQKGDAFSHSRAVAGVSIGDANSTILGDYDLNASVGTNVDVEAGGVIHIESEIDDANFGSQQTNDPRDPSERFGANAQADTGGIVADSHANAITRLGTAATPSQSLVSLGRFSNLRAPTVELISDITDIRIRSDANARAAGAAVIVASNSTGELHSDSKVLLSGDSFIDATTTTLESLQGTGSQLRMEVESTTDKDGVFGDPASLVTIRQDSLSKIEASDGASIRTRNLTVRGDTNVSEFKATSLENGLVRSGSGGITSSFDRDRNILWNADVYLKGAPSPKLTVEANGATGATVTEAVGVTIVDTDGNPNNPFDTGTIGNVAAPTIVVNPINNASAFGNILFEIPLINAGEDASMTGRNGTFTVDRAFDDVIIQNNSNKPLQVGNINVINLGTPTVVIDVPISNTLAFDVFQDFGDTNLSIKNTTRSGTPSITLSGVINNPVGETTVESAGGILRTNTGTVTIVTNVADLTAKSGNVGSVASRIPIELIVSEGRQEDLNVSASGSVALDLIARIRQPGTSTPVSIDASNVVATNSTANILLHSSVQEIQEPTVLPLLRVNEIKQNDITFVEAHFEAVEEFPVVDLGVLGTSTTVIPVASNWNFDLVKGSSVAINLAELGGPNMGITSGTDVGSGAIDVATNGDISLTETTGPMRIGAVTTTRGNVSLNSNNAIVVSPTDAAADVVGTIVNLNAATAIGTATAPVDVDSTSRLNATATGDMFLVETNGNMNVGAVTSSGG